MAESLKQKTISGMLWNGVERFGSSFFLFISNLVLARLLSPDDFGCIGMLMVFISVSDAIIDGGFGSALIQKKDPTETDYSTVFYWNLILSLLLYLVLYFSAPAISRFYDIALLSDVLKVQGLILMINAFVLIQQNILRKQVAFKKLAKINLSAIVLGTGTGIIFAYLGFGVWSLVIKSLVTGLVQCIIYWLSSHWRPQWVFSWTSFRGLFKFGGFMFLTVIVNNLYHNFITLIIGKSFSAATLGYFTQAKKLEDVPRNSLSAVITNVTFPVFSHIQDDIERLLNAARKCTKSMAFLNFPLMMLLIVTAEPLFTMLFTDKWSQSVPYFQVLCVYGLILSPSELNNNIIRALGKSNISLYIMVTQRSIGIILILIGLLWGMKGMLLGYVLSQYIGFAISANVLGRLMGYGLFKQCKDCFSILLLSSSVTAIIFLLSILLPDMYYVWMFCLQIIVFITLYVGLSVIFKIEGAEPYHHFLKTKILK